MTGLFCLQRHKALRHPSTAFVSRYPGQLPHPYHQLPQGAPSPMLFRPRAGPKGAVHSASANLILTVAVLLSLALCFMAAAHWGDPNWMAAAQRESSLSQPGARKHASLRSGRHSRAMDERDAFQLEGNPASLLLSEVNVEDVPVPTPAATARMEAATFAALRQAAYAALEGQPATWAAALAEFAATASSLAAGQRAAADALGDSVAIDEIPFPGATAEQTASARTAPGNLGRGSALGGGLEAAAGKEQVGHTARQGEAVGTSGDLDGIAAGIAGQLPRMQTVPGNRAKNSDGSGRAAGEGKAALQGMPERAAVAELHRANPTHGAATAADLAAQPVQLSDPAAGHSVEAEVMGGAAAGVRTTETAVAEDVALATVAEPPPAGVAAAAKADHLAKAALLEQVMKEGKDSEVDVQHTRPRIAIKRRRRDSVYFGEEELDEDDYS